MPKFITIYNLSAGVSDAADTDELGITDPTFDRSLNIGETEKGLDGTDESNELEVGETIALIQNLGTEYGEPEIDIDAGALVDEPEIDAQIDDENGPSHDSELLLEFSNTEELSETDDDEQMKTEYAFDDLPDLESDQALSDDSEQFVESQEDASDASLNWAAQPWSELKLKSTFVARRSLNARRNILVAAGDTVGFHSLDDLEPINLFPPPLKGLYASFLDNSCKSVLVVKPTGQVVVWDCEAANFDLEANKEFSSVDQAAEVCFDPADRIWIRTSDGRLLRPSSDARGFEPEKLPGRCMAICSSDRTLLCLVRHSSKLCLLAVAPDGDPGQVGSEGLSELLAARDVKMSAFEELVVVGARGLGLWLSSDGGTSFRKATGCRGVTAFTIGHYLGRSYVWAALFYELEDRAEVVSIDMKTSRVQKVFEYRVLTDSQGPEDDPPERARIDCLLWDSSRSRILVAGCFGLACFVPTPSSPPSS